LKLSKIGGELVFHVRPPRRIDPRLVFRPIRNALREGGTKAHLKSCHTGEACSGREQGAAAHGKNGSRPSHYGTSPWAEGPRNGGRARCTESSVCVQALGETATLWSFRVTPANREVEAGRWQTCGGRHPDGQQRSAEARGLR